MKDKIGKKLHTANLILRVALNKITFGIFPKPILLGVQDSNLSYRQVARRADLGTSVLVSFLVYALFRILFARNIL